MWHTFPLLLDITGRKCVVIGGGTVATRRALALIEGGADVTIVAPSVAHNVQELAEAGTIHLIAEKYSPDVVAGAFLVVAATNDGEVNAQVTMDARAAGCIVNDTDEPDRGNCIFPAVMRRGELVISVTTGGASPALTGRIQDELAITYGAEYEPYIVLLGEVRQEALLRVGDDDARKAALRALVADRRILELIRAGRMDDARVRAFACISSSLD